MALPPGEPPAAKRIKLSSAPPRSRRAPIFTPFRTVGLVSPTPVPFASVPLGKSTFQLTTSVGRSLQTYDLRRGLDLVFITRPQTPGPITATTAWADKVAAAWSHKDLRRVWIFKRGKKIGELEAPPDSDEDIVQLHVFGSWLVACCRTKIEVWSADNGQHYTTLASPLAAGNILTGGICSMPTFINKIFAGREDGSVEIWNVSTGKLVYRILPASADQGPVTVLEPTPALSMLAIGYLGGALVIQDVRVDKEILRLNTGLGDTAPTTCVSFRSDGLGAGEDGHDAGVMATASYGSGDVTLWDLNHGGRRMGTLRQAHAAPDESGAAGGISGLQFLSGQSVLVTSGLDNSLKTWIFDETPYSPVPRPLHSRQGHGAPVTTLNFLPNDADGPDAGGKWLLSTSKDRSFWGFSLRRDAQSTEISQGAVQSKAKKLGGSTTSKSTQVQDLKAPEITALACSLNRDGGIGALPGVKTLWASAKQLKGKSTATEQNLTGWESVVTAHKGDKAARTWFWGRKRAGRWVLETSDSTEVTSVAISPCGTFAVLGSSGGIIDMYNLQSGMHRQRFPAQPTPAQAKAERHQAPATRESLRNKHTAAVTGLHVDNTNRSLISVSADGTIKYWNFLTGQLQSQVDWRTETTVQALKSHRPTDMMALACDDLHIRVVDIETQKVVRELQGCKGTIDDYCFSNDGRWVVACSADAVLRVWDLPTGHLIDAMQLPSRCRAVAFSNTGEFLATSQDDGVGVHVWTNRALFTPLPARPIDPDDVCSVAAPTASGEGGRGMLAAAFDHEGDDADDQDGALPTLDQLSHEVETLSLVPRSRWQTLLQLDVIRERNKPTEAPKAPERAPFFLSALHGASSTTTPAPAPAPAAPSAERSRILKASDAAASRFTQLVRAADHDGLVAHLQTLGPAAADVELRSLSAAAPYTELLAFVHALTRRLQQRRDYELVQAWMAVFLRCHGDVLAESAALLAALREWRTEQKREAERLGQLAGYCSGVVQFLRAAR